MFLANKKNNEKLYSLHKLINKVFEFSINVKNAAYLPSYRRVQWESLEKTLNKIGTIINSLSEYNKFKIAFIIECLLNSNKFKTANIDNQIVFLKFLSELKNKFLSACSIFENTKTILENLENQDIANTIKFENIKNNENDFYNQLTNIKNKFTYDKQESVNIQIFPVCVLNNKNVDGQIQCVESTISNISNDNINNIYKDSCISQISNI